MIQDAKTQKSNRDVDLTPQAVKALDRHRAKQAAERRDAGTLYKDQNLIFATSFGAPINLNTEVPRHFKRILAAAELPTMSLYALKHSFATISIERGEDIKVLADALGHANVATTLNRYVRPTGEMQKARAKRFGERPAAPTPMPT